MNVDCVTNLENLKQDIANTLKFNENTSSKQKEYIEQAEVKFEKWEERLQERERRIEEREKELEVRHEVILFILCTLCVEFEQFTYDFVIIKFSANKTVLNHE